MYLLMRYEEQSPSSKKPSAMVFIFGPLKIHNAVLLGDGAFGSIILFIQQLAEVGSAIHFLDEELAKVT